MAGFLYFTEGTVTEGQAHNALRAAGAGYVLEGTPQTTDGPTTGPEGKRGSIVAPSVGEGGKQADPLHTEKCEWVEVPPVKEEGKAGYWIGYDPARKPTPADLVHPKGFTGHPVDLGDGETWLVPAIRHIDGSSAFPEKMALVDGKWRIGDVVKRYAALWEDACRVFQMIIAACEATTGAADKPDAAADPDESPMSMGELADIVARLLSLNYRLGRHEVDILELFETKSLLKAAHALVDWPAIKKKAEAAGSSSTPGGEA